jgi:hypothetical protein
MDEFVPSGFMTLQRSVERVGKTLFESAWEAPFSEAETDELYRIIDAIRPFEALGTLSAITDGRNKLQQRAALTDSSRSLLERFVAQEGRKGEIIHSLRQALFQEKLAASILTVKGHLIPVPSHVWASVDAPRIFDTGQAEFTLQCGFEPYCFKGRVLLGEYELNQWMHARVSKDSSTIGAEQRCRRWLVELMKRGPQIKPKRQYEEEAKTQFGVGRRAFARAWENAKQDSSTNSWGKPGPKS